MRTVSLSSSSFSVSVTSGACDVASVMPGVGSAWAGDGPPATVWWSADGSRKRHSELPREDVDALSATSSLHGILCFAFQPVLMVTA